MAADRDLPALAAATTLALAALAPAQARFQDPAPPEVKQLPAMPRPSPKDYAGLRSGTAPKVLPEGAETHDWPGFLGPRQDARCRETHLLREWPAAGPALVWSMQCGEGYASPVVQGDQVVFTHRVGDDVHVDCLEATTGRRFWRFSYGSDYRGQFISDGGPRSTPVISGGYVYVHAAQGTLYCLELATGRPRWQRDLGKELGTEEDFFGVVSSPVVYGDLLIQQLGVEKGPCVAAFDKATGRIAWGAGDKWTPSCTSPVLGTVHGRDRVFVLAGGDSKPPTGGLLAIDPKTGAVDFTHPFRSKLYLSVAGTSPLVGDGFVFLSQAYGVGSELLTLDENGGYTSRWKNRRVALQFSNPVLQSGHIYAIDGKSERFGAIVCLDPKDGKELSRTDLNWDEKVQYQGRAMRHGANVGEGSLLVADDSLLCLGDQGHLLWLDVSPQGAKVRARTWLFRSNWAWTPPVISRGLLYVRQTEPERFGDEPRRLLCYDFRASSGR